VKQVKTVSILIFTILFSLCYSCKNVVFDNPLDPNASKAVVDIIKVMETVLVGRGDLAFDGEKLWKIDNSGFLTAIDRESGIVIRSFSSSPGTGISFLKDKLYICNARGENTLITVDPLSGDILNRISMREIYPGYLANDGDQLIIYDTRSSGVYSYDPETRDSIRLFELSGLNIGGIAVYKGGLIVSDMNTDTIYHFSLSGAALSAFTSPASGIGGIAVDSGDYIYLFMLDGKIYKVSLP